MIMKKNTYIFLGIFACMITATLLFTSINQTRTSSNVDGSSQTMTNTHPNQDINGYFEWLSARRGDAITGEINLKQYYAALEATEASRRTNSRALSLDWIELGPNNVGGRTRALLIDQDDNSTLLAGGVGGGLWKSETSGTSWFQVSGIDDFLTVSSICQAKNGDIYVGTGEGLYTNFGNGAGGLPGNGIYKSTDGGDTFVHLSATTPVANKITERWAHVNALAASPNSNRIYAGTERGLMISTDGGATWIAASSGTLTTSTITDLAVGPDGTMHASVG